MQSNSSLPFHPGPLSPVVVAPDTVPLKRTIWHLNCEQTDDLCWIELLGIELFDDLIVRKQVTDV